MHGHGRTFTTPEGEFKLLFSTVRAAIPWPPHLSETREMRRRAGTHLLPRLASNSHAHSPLWGSHPKDSVSLASSKVFSEAVCWYGFVKTVVYPSEGNFAFGVEPDGKYWPQPPCTASCDCFLLLSLPLRPSVVNKRPFGLGPDVSPLLSPGGRKSTLRPSPVCYFCSPKPDFYSGCFIGHQWMHFIASLGDLILLLCH